jgi:hypothetical protein
MHSNGKEKQDGHELLEIQMLEDRIDGGSWHRGTGMDGDGTVELADTRIVCRCT